MSSGPLETAGPQPTHGPSIKNLEVCDDPS